MVVSTYKELIFKKSKKQHQILAQTAYYQAGKIVIQTILPEQPPVALITLNTLGTTCSTSADTYIPIENISNTQSCSFLESRLVSLYGGKAASLLIEYQQCLSLYLPFNVYPSVSLDRSPFSKTLAPPSKAKLPSDSLTSFTSYPGEAQEILVRSKKGEPAPDQKMLAKQSGGVKTSNKYILNAGLLSRRVTESNRKEGLHSLETSSNGEALHLKGAPLESKGTPGVSKAAKESFKKIEVRGSISISSSFDNIFNVSAKQERGVVGSSALLKNSLSKPAKKVDFANDLVDNTSIYTNKEPISYFNNLINNVQSWVLNPSKSSPLQTGLTKSETKGSSLLNIEDVSKGVIDKVDRFIDEGKGLSLDHCQTHLAKIYFAGTGNNIFQSTLGNLEIQTATRLASIMVNYWNFYSLNKKPALRLCGAKPWPQHKISASFPNVKSREPGSPLLTSLSDKMLSKGEPAPYNNMQSSYSKGALVSFPSGNTLYNSRKQGFAEQSNGSLLNGYNIQDVSTNIDNVDVSKSTKGSSKIVPLLLHKPKELVELNSYVFEKNQRQAFFTMQSRRLNRAIFSKPLSLAALQTYYSASFDRKPFKALPSKARQDQTSLSNKMLANQSVGVKGQRDLRSKGFEEIAEGYKHQPAPDSSINKVNRSVQGKPRFNRLFTPKQYKALRFYTDREPLLYSAKYNAKVIPLLSFAYPKGLAKLNQESEIEKQSFARPFRVVRSDKEVKESKPLLTATFHHDKYKVKVWDLTSKVKDKTPKDLHFAIVQSKNSLKICENKNFSYHIRRLSVENIGSYSQLNNNNFQLLNSLQFSNLRRDRFSPHWFRLYLPDIEATEFLKNVANYYFNLGLQTLTLPSTKLNPFSTFLDKHTLNPRGFYSSCFLLQRSINTSYYNLLMSYESPINYTRPLGMKQRLCIGKPPSERKDARGVEVESLKGWVSTARPRKVFTATENKKSVGSTSMPDSSINEVTACFTSLEMKALWGTRGLQNWESIAKKQRRRELKIRESSCGKTTKDLLNTPFSLLVENQIFPLNYNNFSIVEKELLYDTLVNSCFAKAFSLINQNRQLLDFLVDYLLRFQILRQHQILYIFSTLLVGCNKSQLVNL